MTYVNKQAYLQKVLKKRICISKENAKGSNSFYAQQSQMNVLNC